MSLTLASVLAESALRRPGHTALVHASRRIGYAELWYATRQYAAALRERGTRPGDRIALLLPNTPHFPMVYYGVLALGAVAVPVHGLLRAEEIAHGSALPVAVLEEFEEVFGCRGHRSPGRGVRGGGLRGRAYPARHGAGSGARRGERGLVQGAGRRVQVPASGVVRRDIPARPQRQGTETRTGRSLLAPDAAYLTRHQRKFSD